MKKLAVFFPGIGYTVDKPLLSDSRKIVEALGYEIKLLPYQGFPEKVKGDRARMVESFRIALEQTEENRFPIKFFPYTTEYANRYRDEHPQAIFKIAKNYEQIFMDVCEDIGPPARMMRWCCSMFKTGPITRVINSLYRNQQILTFYGIRKAESVSRSKYNRVENGAESVKIQQSLPSTFAWITTWPENRPATS